MPTETEFLGKTRFLCILIEGEEVMKAQDLRQALNILNPEAPLQTEKQLRDYFVTRPMSPLEDLSILLQDTTDPQKVLFTGHRGSGKSTELAKLTQGLQGQFFIIHYSIKSILNLFDLNYVDVVLSLGLKLIKEATTQQIQVEEKVLCRILDFTKRVCEKSTENTKKRLSHRLTQIRHRKKQKIVLVRDML